MPTIVRIGNLKIRIYMNDHNPPHFHVETPDYRATIGIADFRILDGALDRRTLDVALAWARPNKKVLEDEWKRLNP
jgi:hypothetical protein